MTDEGERSKRARRRDGDVKLARMAGEIAAFFRAYPEETAVAAVAEHINLFWSARMRADLLACAENGVALDELTRAALPKILPPRAEPTDEATPTEENRNSDN